MSTATPRRRTSVSEAPITRTLERLHKIFETAPSKHQAHASSRDLIAEAARDPTFLSAVLARHIRAPDALDRLHYPVVAFEIDSNPLFDLGSVKE